MAILFTDNRLDSVFGVIVSSFIICIVIVGCSFCQQKKTSSSRPGTKDEEQPQHYCITQDIITEDDDGYTLPIDLPDSQQQNYETMFKRATIPRSQQNDKENVCVIDLGTTTRVAIGAVDGKYSLASPSANKVEIRVISATPSIQLNKNMPHSVSKPGSSSLSLTEDDGYLVPI